MLTRSLVTALVSLVVVLSGDAFACGDKFLVPSRGVRFQRMVDRESASVLLYAHPGSALSETFRTLAVEAKLRSVGYRPTLVTSVTELEGALRAGAWDVVVVDLADGHDVVVRLSAAAAPMLLPVVHEVSRQAFAEAKRHYQRVLKAPKRSQAFVEAVDSLIAARARSRTRSVARAGG